MLPTPTLNMQLVLICIQSGSMKFLFRYHSQCAFSKLFKYCSLSCRIFSSIYSIFFFFVYSQFHNVVTLSIFTHLDTYNIASEPLESSFLNQIESNFQYSNLHFLSFVQLTDLVRTKIIIGDFGLAASQNFEEEFQNSLKF